MPTYRAAVLDEVVKAYGAGWARCADPTGLPALTRSIDRAAAVVSPATDCQAVLPVDAPSLRRDDVIRCAGSLAKATEGTWTFD